jgi:hypothetical protein
MQKAIAVATGRVAWCGDGSSKSGKAHRIIRIELASREHNGRVYRSYVTVHDYQMKETANVGDWVTAAGDADAVIEQGRENKTYAKLLIVGRVTKLPVPQAQPEDPEADHAGEA